MNYYKQGDPANADKIKAAFEKLGYDTGILGFTSSQLYYTIEGKVDLMYPKEIQNLIKTHPDYKELELAVKPKFKVGDWVVKKDGKTFYGGNYSVQITLIEVDEGSKHIWLSSTTWVRDNDIRPWSIADAKDGDVLVYQGEIFLFNLVDNNSVLYYCCFDGELVVHSFYAFSNIDLLHVHPATKEQRDLLFAKMREAGYEWDEKKKELKKINEKDMNEKEQTNTVRYIDKLVCEVEKVLMGLGYKVFVEFNGSTKLWCVELLNANSSEEMPFRHKSMIRGLVKGYLHSFDYFGGTQKIYIYDECKGLNPEDERYSTLENAMSKVSDNHKNDIFVNYGTHTERYVIDNNDKRTVNIAISEPKRLK